MKTVAPSVASLGLFLPKSEQSILPQPTPANVDIQGSHQLHESYPMNPGITALSIVRSAVLELLRSALAADPSAAGVAREVVRNADGEHLESELLEVLRAALARLD